MKTLGALLFASAFVWADIPVESKISLTSGYRQGKFDTNRALAVLTARPVFGTVETTAQVWGWYNASFENYGTREYDVSLRTLKAQYWGENWGVSAGLQEIHWGETFGFQPLDVLNNRNFRDFPFLDHGLNRIPAPILQMVYASESWKVEGVFNPRPEYPILPRTVRGFKVVEAPDAEWFKDPEFGLRLSALAGRGNASVYYFRGINRIPVLMPDITVVALRPIFKMVNNVGASFSYATDEWVWRGDLLAALEHPVVGPQPKTAFGAVVGADWSPQAIEGFTVGIQFQADGYPLAGDARSTGGSLVARKSLWDNKIQLEAQAYRSFRYQDYWVRAQADLGLGQGWQLQVLAETSGADPASPLALMPQGPRLAATGSYSF